MIRTLLFFAIVVAPLAARQEACSRPPEEVANSPIPSLRQLPQQSSTRTERNLFLPARPRQQETPSHIPTANSLRASLRQQTTPPQQRSYAGATHEVEGTAKYSEEQKEIWNSPEMVAARAVIEEFCRHSAQTSPTEGQQFLTQLSQLSPEEMRNWLERYQTRRMNDLLGREVEQLARHLMVERSLSLREARRQATARIAELRSQATAAREEQYPTPQQLAAARRMRHLGVVTIGVFPGYDPLDAVVDPASPRGYGRKVAAAMSLPGDLPRDDPRNFLRGDEGIDLGEWATSRDAQPPAPQVAPAPAAPANDVPANE